MSTTLYFQGVIKNLSYTVSWKTNLKIYSIKSFDINTSKASGIINLGDDGNMIGYSKWVSPKRTRSYPFARIYDTYYLPKKVTIIPIIKDEGMDGDNDRINYITFSWMNLLNVYIILAWYSSAQKHPFKNNKISKQTFDKDYINEKILEISNYHQTALHWNIKHFENDFDKIYVNAIKSYQNISQKLGVAIHSPEDQLNNLKKYQENNTFTLKAFKEHSLPSSALAANRELSTIHSSEYLYDGLKGYISITNWVGGEYHLTVDEVYKLGDVYIIQESKNSTNDKLPKIADVKDGLFKLILFVNIDELYLDGQMVDFSVRLKLSGNLVGTLELPSSYEELSAFALKNSMTMSQLNLIQILNVETVKNSKLKIIITGNQVK